MCLSLFRRLYQAISKYSIVAPFTLDVSGVTVLEVVFLLVLGFNFYVMPLVPLVCAVLGIVYIYKLYLLNNYINLITMILSGIILNIFNYNLPLDRLRDNFNSLFLEVNKVNF